MIQQFGYNLQIIYILGHLMIFTTTTTSTFTQEFEELLQRGKMDMEHVGSIVGNIINEIKTDKNAAVKQHIAKFDNWIPESDFDLKVPTDFMKVAYDNLDDALKAALHMAY